jgi:hypothetical protein
MGAGGAPCEDGKWSGTLVQDELALCLRENARKQYGLTYQLAFRTVIFLDHLDVGILRQTRLADRREVGRLPS